MQPGINTRNVHMFITKMYFTEKERFVFLVTLSIYFLCLPSRILDRWRHSVLPIQAQCLLTTWNVATAHPAHTTSRRDSIPEPKTRSPSEFVVNRWQPSENNTTFQGNWSTAQICSISIKRHDTVTQNFNKRPAEESHPSNAKVKDAWSFTSSSYVFTRGTNLNLQN